VPLGFLARLGEPYITTRAAGRRAKSEAGSGMGLGLFIAQQLTRHHGAGIRIESSAEGPTCVSVEFSLNDGDCHPSKSSDTSFVGHFGSRS
jgi:two-component system sensor histidine kinase RegB